LLIPLILLFLITDTGKSGRGSENKVPFVAAVRTTTDVRARIAAHDYFIQWRIPPISGVFVAD
jgi:hypothetical protein